MTVPYQICTRCIMDTTDPDIVFDANGWCNHCTGWFERSTFYALPLRGTHAAARHWSWTK